VNNKWFLLVYMLAGYRFFLEFHFYPACISVELFERKCLFSFTFYCLLQFLPTSNSYGLGFVFGGPGFDTLSTSQLVKLRCMMIFLGPYRKVL
jgi:hypothetical protein